MLTKSPDDLAAVLETHGPAGLVLLLEELNDTREWFANFVRVLEGVEARVLVAASRVAVKEA